MKLQNLKYKYHDHLANNPTDNRVYFNPGRNYLLINIVLEILISPTGFSRIEDTLFLTLLVELELYHAGETHGG